MIYHTHFSHHYNIINVYQPTLSASSTSCRHISHVDENISSHQCRSDARRGK